MRVLWCTHSLAGFSVEKGGYNGCGWITSLLNEFKKRSDIEIAIAFFYKSKTNPVTKDGIKYFPIEQEPVSVIGKIKTYFGDYSVWEKEEKKHLRTLDYIICEFKPDVIHVWGTETEMGQVVEYTKVPVIVHLQGILNPYQNALFPPGVSRFKYVTKDGVSPIAILRNINSLNYWRYKAEREVRTFKSCKNYFGRTHWDKAICSFYSPKCNYFQCSELLRDEFYDAEAVVPKEGLKIVSTISSPLYKGADLVLRTAHLLKNVRKIDFEWNIIGVSNVSLQEKITGIKASDVSVKCIGIKSAIEIKEIESKSHLYFHPSYIDNSPNSVCEAQLLGLPVVAVNVGGISSLIKHMETGILTPPNEPHMAAFNILQLYSDMELHEQIAYNSKIVAKDRHDPLAILDTLLTAYRKLIK